jgi:hypothetical protein
MTAQFVEDLLRQFLPPAAAKADPDAFVADYVKVLGQFSPKVLDEVLADLVCNTASRNFPSVAECLRRCREKHAQLNPPKPKKSHWSGEGAELARRLIVGEMGRQAVAEGWIIGLWDFCFKKGRRPNSLEADAIKSKSRQLERDFADLGSSAGASGCVRARALRIEHLKKLVCDSELQDEHK